MNKNIIIISFFIKLPPIFCAKKTKVVGKLHTFLLLLRLAISKNIEYHCKTAPVNVKIFVCTIILWWMNTEWLYVLQAAWQIICWTGYYVTEICILAHAKVYPETYHITCHDIFFSGDFCCGSTELWKWLQLFSNILVGLSEHWGGSSLPRVCMSNL